MPGKSWIPQLTRLITNPSPERVQDNVATALQGFANGVADGQLLSLSIDTTKASVSGSPPSFTYLANHPLGRKPQGVLPGLPNCNCYISLSPNQPSGIDPTMQVLLNFKSGDSQFPNTLTVPLWFF